MPAYAAVLTLVSLSSIGLPGTNGFVGEFLVLLGTFRTHPVAAGIAATGVVFAAAYLLWALQRVIYYRLDKTENQGLTDLVPREWGVLVPLVVVILWLGLFPGPVLRRMEPSARHFIESVQGRPAPAVADASGARTP
jgi:NADH-quinone oxidoreductase subunit M